MKRRHYLFIALILITGSPLISFGQTGDSIAGKITLQQCVSYALQHQPLLQQALIDEAITESAIKSRLSEWYPQVYVDYSVQHNFQVPTTIFQGNPVKIGVNNTSYTYFSATQNIFNRDVLLASRSAKDVRIRAKQNTSANKIDITVNVSKAFYDVLLTMIQIRILDADILLLQESYKNALNQYKGGVVDKIDYKRATISLNNANAVKKASSEQLKARYAVLKQQMGYPDSLGLALQYDSLQFEQDAFIDTTLAVSYENRIEIQTLQTQQRLQQSNLKYYKWAYYPEISAFGNYNLNFQNNEFSKLYSQNYPNSFAGLKLSLPIFQGGKRNQEIRQADLELKRVDLRYAKRQKFHKRGISTSHRYL
jgi:outer membrane protein TolC